MADSSSLARLASEAERDGVHQLVVGAVVHHHGRVLLLRRPDDDFMGGIFELPSGKVEVGEGLGEALVREVTEETGLVVATISDYLGRFDYESGSGKVSRQFNFAVEIREPEPIKLAEHDAYIWATLNEPLPVTDSVMEVLGRCRELTGD
ncbi:NUDIX domain-containing protein [Microlunatus parietis]|uniref:8-oxo-dGTP diphosphatase n=1 Tax=Microlunatus parietis TaxID=682979 RepID=A0A7Y9IAT2_9ACTN|nr:NUDIX domain-containing protein [Microlunatus parietis]NYE73488.1 8-oxo-dGTP diphosphatase [Microlunatus parietis]